MSTLTLSPAAIARIEDARAIGSAHNALDKATKAVESAKALTKTHADAVLLTIPADTVFGKGKPSRMSFVAAYLTDGGKAPALMSGPRGAQTETTYGRGARNIDAMVGRLLKARATESDESDESDESGNSTPVSGMTLTLNGQTITISEDHALYADLAALFTAS